MSTYKAIVSKIDRVSPIEGADKIQTAYVLGEQVVVSKGWNVGDIGIFFPADCQLSDMFCYNNNLYRDSEKNVDKNSKGFFDDNRRVRCQPFMKVKSEGFFCEITSLLWCVDSDILKLRDLKVGDKFDTLNGHQICQKYISEQTRKKMLNVSKKKTKVSEAPQFHKHVDTEQLKYYLGAIPKGALISIHAKVHGTSARYSYSTVRRKPIKVIDKIKDKFGLFKRESLEYLVGTRNVVLYEDQYNKEGFHGSEQFRFDVLEMLKPYLEKGMTIYGEISGYANGKPIMGTHSTELLKDKKYNKKYGKIMTYAYGCKEHEFRFHVYRISYTNEDGIEIDFTDKQVMKWCDDHSLNGPVAVCEPFIYNGFKDALMEKVEALTERIDVLTEDYIDPTHVSEGVVIRVDDATLVPKFYKNKSYAFKVMEGIFKENNEDMEDSA